MPHTAAVKKVELLFLLVSIPCLPCGLSISQCVSFGILSEILGEHQYFAFLMISRT